MQRLVQGLGRRILDGVANRIAQRIVDSGRLSDGIAYRLAMEALAASASDKAPMELFHGISDGFWFWLCAEGYQRHPSLRAILPGLPDEAIQLNFTGSKGEQVLREGFRAYVLLKEQYETHVGPLAKCGPILDFGCGWGRIIRFFLKDVEPSRLVGIDPVKEMIEFCTSSNKWCRFELMNRRPPTRFPDNMFDLIYGYSVFSHLSEKVHEDWLAELRRILRPGGLLVVTTRDREFIAYCAVLRKDKRLNTYPDGIKVSAVSFPDVKRSLADYDQGRYVYTSHGYSGDWDYWGDTAIPKGYVLSHWTQYLTFVDYIDDRTRCSQNIIVMKK
ncbi:MAG: methyltransferase [Candidatus Rokuibacteriota bacterium]|nr:MAG: methyltransferase [Candidatus Rokubacteria bacterium]